MDKRSLSKFENDVINKLLSGDNETIKILRNQFEKSVINEKEYTGHGFYINFSIPDFIEKTKNEKFQIGDVGANIEGLKHGVGFLLFVKNGMIDFLEAYTYGEEFPVDFNKYELFYINFKGEKRDFSNLL
jgi:hypothetical protein